MLQNDNTRLADNMKGRMNEIEELKVRLTYLDSENFELSTFATEVDRLN